MTARERLHKLVDELSEAEADETLRFAAARHKKNVDEWGDLDAFGDALTGDALSRLDQQERAELGETIAEASARKRPKLGAVRSGGASIQRQGVAQSSS